MSVLRLRFWLPPAALAMLLGAGAAVVWSLVTPCRVEVAAAAAKPKTKAAAAARKDEVKLAPEALAGLLRRRWQAPLFDPPPPKPPPPVKKELPPLPLKLLATMPEPNGGCAMFAESGGSTLIKAVGDRIVAGSATVELLEVADSYVVLRQQQQRVTMKLAETTGHAP